MNCASLAFVATLLFVPCVQAQQSDISKGLSLELNTAETVQNACKLTFVITNGHMQQVDQAIFETVLFNPAGQVSVITLFDMGALPPGLPRVRQFVVPEVACEDLGRVLINGVSTCTGAQLPEAACTKGLAISTRTSIEVIG
jgi:hypothetical protein